MSKTQNNAIRTGFAGRSAPQAFPAAERTALARFAVSLPGRLALTTTAGAVLAFAALLLVPETIIGLIDHLGLIGRARIVENYDNLVIALAAVYLTILVLLVCEYALNARSISMATFSPRVLPSGEPAWFTRACIAATAISALTVPVFLLRVKLDMAWLYVEDGPMEYWTALAFASATVIVLMAARDVSRNDLPRSAKHYLIALSLLFAFVALEEISWGQRIVGFATPADIAAVNTQGEVNLHNIFSDYMNMGYFVAGLLFMAACAGLAALRSQDTAPDWLRYAPHPFLVPLAALIAMVSVHIDLNELLEPMAAAFVLLYALQLRLITHAT